MLPSFQVCVPILLSQAIWRINPLVNLIVYPLSRLSFIELNSLFICLLHSSSGPALRQHYWKVIKLPLLRIMNTSFSTISNITLV
jgi:hypothetical protein